MENRRRVGAHPAGHHHVAELAHRAVSEHTLDVGLHHGDGCRHEKRGRPDHRDDVHRRGGEIEEKIGPRHHVDARRHHRRRMDQRADGRGALHRVGKPDEERNLRALAGRPAEEKEANQGDGSAARRQLDRCGLEDFPEVEGSENADENEHRDQKTEIADPVDDKCLLARLGRGGPLEPESDQEVAAQAHALPTDEEDEKIRAENQGEHEENKQVEINKVAHRAPVAVHVPNRVNVNEGADPGDDQRHHRGKRIEHETGVDSEGPDGYPLEQIGANQPLVLRQPEKLDKSGDRGREGQRHDAGRDLARELFSPPPAEDQVHQYPGHGEQ